MFIINRMIFLIVVPAVFTIDINITLSSIINYIYIYIINEI